MDEMPDPTSRRLPGASVDGLRRDFPRFIAFWEATKENLLAVAQQHRAPDPERCVQQAFLELLRMLRQGEVSEGPEGSREIEAIACTTVQRKAMDQKFAVFWEATKEKLLAIAERRGALYPEECIQDAATELFVLVREGQVNEGPEGRLEAEGLACTIVQRRAVDQRRHYVVSESYARLESDAAPVVTDLRLTDLKHDVQEALATLDPKERHAAGALVEHGGITDHADTLGVHKNTINWYAQKARKKLLRRLADWRVPALMLAWLNRRRWTSTMGLAAAALLFLLPWKKDSSGCYSNPNSSGSPTLCLNVQQMDDDMWRYRVCKQDGVFVNHYTTELEEIGGPGRLEPMSDYAGTKCSTWSTFGGAKRGSSDVYVRAIVTSPRGCTESSCRYHTGKLILPFNYRDGVESARER